jgi:hypothetical protein
MPPTALDFVEQAYVRVVATSRVGFVVIAENVEIFPLVAEKADVINSKASVAPKRLCRVTQTNVCALRLTVLHML